MVHNGLISRPGLHARTIYQRDIKLPNLFPLGINVMVGNFSLVSEPEKGPITDASNKLGPLWFLAPEMLTNPAAAASGPADVYSLAKSLGPWQRACPPQGQQRTDTPELSIVDYVEHPSAHLLDRLVERATSHDPDDRPTMIEMAVDVGRSRRCHGDNPQ